MQVVFAVENAPILGLFGHELLPLGVSKLQYLGEHWPE